LRVIDTTTVGLDLDSVKRMKAAGVSAVGMYVYAGGDWKHMHADDVKLLRDNGIDIFAICEPGDADIVDDNGAALAKGSADAIRALGGPERPFVWFGQDKDISDPAPVLRVLDQAASVLGRDRVGVYANGRVCKAAIARGYRAWLACAYGWAESGYYDDGWHPAQIKGITMVQLVGSPYGFLGMDYDGNDVKAAVGYFGQWKGAPVEVDPTREAVLHLEHGQVSEASAMRKGASDRCNQDDAVYVPREAWHLLERDATTNTSPLGRVAHAYCNDPEKRAAIDALLKG
jgi:hypothetical protein